MSRRLARLAVAACLACSACAGARSSMVAPDARYPVSLSPGMRGPDGRLLRHDEMKVIGHFHDERRAWGLLYSWVPLTPHLDESSAINAQVASTGGDAVIRLQVDSSPCGIDYVFILNFLPFWPGCANVVIDGDIVRYQPLEPR
jgi:hypothetical protein